MSHIGDKWFYNVHCMLKQKLHTSNSVAVSLNRSIFTIFVLCQSTSTLWMNQPSIHVLLSRKWLKMYNRLADLKMFLLPVHDILNQKSWSNWTVYSYNWQVFKAFLPFWSSECVLFLLEMENKPITVQFLLLYHHWVC